MSFAVLLFSDEPFCRDDAQQKKISGGWALGARCHIWLHYEQILRDLSQWSEPRQSLHTRGRRLVQQEFRGQAVHCHGDATQASGNT
eukprot:5488611-Amphidinium_carterae.1